MKHEFIFGVFSAGRIVFLYNRINCTINQAAVIVGILDLAKDSLAVGHHFACDYASNHRCFQLTEED